MWKLCFMLWGTAGLFLCGSTILHSHQLYMGVAVSPCLGQHLLSDFWFQLYQWVWSATILWFQFAFPWLIILSIFFSYLPFVYLLWGNVYSDSSHFFNWVMCFFKWNFKRFLKKYILDTSPWSEMKFALFFFKLSRWCLLKRECFQIWWSPIHHAFGVNG